MTTPLLLKLIIDGSNAGAVKAIAGVEAAAQKAGASVGQSNIGKGLNEAEGAAQRLETQLKTLPGAIQRVFAVAGIGIGAAELIQLADTYTNMTSRLKLVTQYTGDFQQVFSGLADSARATRSDLVATVDLYTKMSPALQGIGLNGKQSIGVITAINQAIGLSGASSQAAAAALMQLGQGFGSGVLRGEELNSILEQTPGLAQAIADGLGVPLGELRKLGEEGKLTAKSVAEALQKMAPQLEADFAKMPKTVGQALTGLKNEFLQFIGATDNASGGTSALASAISAVADEFRTAGPALTAFSEFLKAMINGIDVLNRVLKTFAVRLGGTAAAIAAAFSGSFSEMRFIMQEVNKDIEHIWMKPLAGAARVDQATADSAKKRGQIEEQLAAQVEKLEKYKTFIATGALDGIVGKEKEAIDKRIAEQQRLVDAVRAAWQQSLKEAEDASKAALGLLDKAGQKRAATADKVTNAKMKGLSPEEQAAMATEQAQSLFDQGRFYAAAANSANLDGRFKQAEAYQKQAEQFLSRAENFADKAGDINLIESIGNAQAAMLESQAKAKQGEAEKLQQQAASQAQLLNELQAKLEALQKSARALEVEVDTTKAISAIQGYVQQLDKIPEKKTTTLEVVSASAGNAAVPAEALPSRAFGGPLPGFAPHDRADNMLYWGTPGEWVIQRPTVRYYGPEFMRQLNARQIPRHAFGGELGRLRPAGGFHVPSMTSGQLSTNKSPSTPLVLDFGKLGRYQAEASADTVKQIEQVFARAALRFGKR